MHRDDRDKRQADFVTAIAELANSLQVLVLCLERWRAQLPSAFAGMEDVQAHGERVLKAVDEVASLLQNEKRDRL